MNSLPFQESAGCLAERPPVANIGLLGGTFNPIHLGHLRLGEEAREQFKLDAVWFIPNPAPPHKRSQIAPSEERFRLVELAVEHNPFFEVSRVELDLPGVAYTVDTVARLREQHPEHDFHFLTGADSLLRSPWKELDRLLGMLGSFVAARRPGFDWRELELHLAELRLTNRDKIVRFDMPALEISSSDIRQRRREGRSIRYLVTEAVRARVEAARLYLEE